MLYNTEWEKPAVRLELWQQHLLDAAEYIRKHGWCQGQPSDSLGRVCAMGALYVTTLVETTPAEAATRLAWHLGFSTNSYVAGWNDNPDRTKEEVIAAMEAAVRGA